MSKAFVLKSLEFRRERESSWRQLEKLVLRVEKRGIRDLGAMELTALPVLYRSALSSLSVARAISLDKALIEYLERLTGRAYFVVYRPKQSPLDEFIGFFGGGFPRALRRTARPLALATAILAVGYSVGYSLTISDPMRFYTFVDPGLAGDRGPQASTEDLRKALFGGDDQSIDSLVGFAAYLFKHNAGIGILSFALGGLAGAPVFLLVFTNGLMLGAFAAIHTTKGLSVELWGWLLPHGVTELLALLICAAAGLRLGSAVVFPGRRKRRDVLASKGKDAGMIALGSILLFIIAGLIEGIFRQRVHGTFLRYVVAGFTAVFWAWYFIACGRKKK